MDLIINVFTGPDKILCFENDLMSAGAWIYFKHESDMGIPEFDEATSSKSVPLFPIKINGNMVDLGTEGATSVNAQSNYLLVQSWMPLTPSQLKELESMGPGLHRYVSKNTYLDEIRQLRYVAYEAGI
jgi:hypothetical protein